MEKDDVASEEEEPSQPSTSRTHLPLSFFSFLFLFLSVLFLSFLNCGSSEDHFVQDSGRATHTKSFGKNRFIPTLQLPPPRAPPPCVCCRCPWRCWRCCSPSPLLPPVRAAFSFLFSFFLFEIFCVLFGGFCFYWVCIIMFDVLLLSDACYVASAVVMAHEDEDDVADNAEAGAEDDEEEGEVHWTPVACHG